jgi:hypothetical protein
LKLVFCSKCGTENEDRANYCAECGNKLEKEIFCSECDVKNPVTSNFCHNCGNLLKPTKLALTKRHEYLKAKRKNKEKISSKVVKSEDKSLSKLDHGLKSIKTKSGKPSTSQVIGPADYINNTAKSIPISKEKIENSKKNIKKNNVTFKTKNDILKSILEQKKPIKTLKKNKKNTVKFNGKSTTIMSLLTANKNKKDMKKDNVTFKTKNDIRKSILEQKKPIKTLKKNKKNTVKINGKSTPILSIYTANIPKRATTKKNTIKINGKSTSILSIYKNKIPKTVIKYKGTIKSFCAFCGKEFDDQNENFCSVKCKFRHYEGYEYATSGLGYIKIADGGKAFKIGYTNNPSSRHKIAQTSNHRRLFLVYQNWESIPEINFEQVLSKKLEVHHRKNQRNEEWFDLNEESKSIIEEHCKITIINYKNKRYEPKLTIIEDLLPEKQLKTYYGPTVYIFLTFQDPAVIIGSAKKYYEKFDRIRTDQHSKLLILKDIEFETSKEANYVARKLRTRFKEYKFNEGGRYWFKPEILVYLNEVDRYISEITSEI